MSKLIRKEIAKLKKNKTDVLDAYFICKKINDRLTLVEFKKLWENLL